LPEDRRNGNSGVQLDRPHTPEVDDDGIAVDKIIAAPLPKTWFSTD